MFVRAAREDPSSDTYPEHLPGRSPAPVFLVRASESAATRSSAASSAGAAASRAASANCSDATATPPARPQHRDDRPSAARTPRGYSRARRWRVARRWRAGPRPSLWRPRRRRPPPPPWAAANACHVGQQPRRAGRFAAASSSCARIAPTRVFRRLAGADRPGGGAAAAHSAATAAPRATTARAPLGQRKRTLQVGVATASPA